jgi:purine-nucleoside phosphorylase
MMSKINVAIDYIRSRGVSDIYRYGLVLGTGLGQVSELISDPIRINYKDIPGYPMTSVSGHLGELIAGKINSVPTLCLSGRTHFYETGRPDSMRLPLEILGRLGVENLILTSTVGSMTRELPPGHVCIIRDHINMTGFTPLFGEPSEQRFVSMTNAYSPKLRGRLKKAATDSNVRVTEATLMWFPGPQFETPAEVRAARTLGADVVGMSVVPEVILARFLGIDVAAMSLVTNYGSGIEATQPSHEETKAMAGDRVMPFRRTIQHFFKGLLTA